MAALSLFYRLTVLLFTAHCFFQKWVLMLGTLPLQFSLELRQILGIGLEQTLAQLLDIRQSKVSDQRIQTPVDVFRRIRRHINLGEELLVAFLAVDRRRLERAAAELGAFSVAVDGACLTIANFARGAFVGLTLRHSRAHMTRAVLEGVAFGLKDILTLIQNTGLGPITQVRASGGGAKGALWRQILASVLEADLVTVNTSEGAAFGAALLAGVGAGAWPEVTYACRESIHITGQILPSSEQVHIYRKIYPLYRELYPVLRSTSGKLSTL